MWAYGIPCPAMVSPNAGPCKENKLLYPDHHLIWCVESGFRPVHIVLVVLVMNWPVRAELAPWRIESFAGGSYWLSLWSY